MARSLIVAMSLLVWLPVMPAVAQEATPPPTSRVRMRLGPLTIDPAIGLTNIGVDQNVFNEPADQNPKSDFTLTVVPKVDARLRLARMLVTGSVNEDLTWYQQYANQRSANTRYALGWQVPFNRFFLKAAATRAHVRDRPGFEIDARAQRTETGYDGTAEVRTLPKTFVGVIASRQREDFAQDAVFLNSNLQHELNRVTTAVGGFVRYQLTPITSVSLIGTRARDRFEFSSLRDSTSTTGAVVVTFDPLGILSGSASFGYKSFETLSPDIPSYKGTTAAVDVSYRLLGTMRISVDAVRDVAYSYDINQPYYLQTGFGGSVSRAVAGPLDVVVRAGIQSLAYRDRAGALIPVSNRQDHVRMYGGGIGYHLGKGSRVGFNIDKTRRISDVSFRQYDDLKFGSSVTYGF